MVSHTFFFHVLCIDLFLAVYSTYKFLLLNINLICKIYIFLNKKIKNKDKNNFFSFHTNFTDLFISVTSSDIIRFDLCNTTQHRN
jgi:hypothetical protein